MKEQLKKEAQIWINLEIHENVTQVQFVHDIDKRIYLFLEYITGGDLSSYIGAKMLDIKLILRFALQFCYE